MIFKFELNILVKDTLTPFQGTIIGRSEYSDNRIQYLVQPNGCTDNGQPITAHWIAETRIMPHDKSQ